MKHLKRFKTFINESFDSEICNPVVDQILTIQDSIDPTKCEFTAFTKDELCEMSEEELHGVLSDVEAAKASCGDEVMAEDEESFADDNDDDDDDSEKFNFASPRPAGFTEEGSDGDFEDDDNFNFKDDIDSDDFDDVDVDGDDRHVLKFGEWDDSSDDEDAYKNEWNDDDFDDDDDLGGDDDFVDEYEEDIESEENHSEEEKKSGYDPDLPSEMW